jgi:hypothetical protein
MIGNPFWLIRVDAPITKKTYFKMSKKIEQKLGGVLPHILCMQKKCFGKIL